MTAAIEPTLLRLVIRWWRRESRHEHGSRSILRAAYMPPVATGTIRIFNLETDNTTRICASTRNVLTEQRWNQVLPALPYDPPCR
jgi:hypothetical protein